MIRFRHRICNCCRFPIHSCGVGPLGAQLPPRKFNVALPDGRASDPVTTQSPVQLKKLPDDDSLQLHTLYPGHPGPGFPGACTGQRQSHVEQLPVKVWQLYEVVLPMVPPILETQN